MKPIHWRRTRFGQYLRHLPRAKNIRGTWLHRRLGDALFASELWHPTRQRFAAGVAVGAFFALMPPPQMLVAGVIAYITRVNVPAAIAATWISNPLTMPLFIYSQYRLGCVLMGRGPSDIPTTDLLAFIKQAPAPFFVGAIPAAACLALICYPVSLLVWDFVQYRIAKRQKRIL